MITVRITCLGALLKSGFGNLLQDYTTRYTQTKADHNQQTLWHWIKKQKFLLLVTLFFIFDISTSICHGKFYEDSSQFGAVSKWGSSK